jgi:hypothetical protein
LEVSADKEGFNLIQRACEKQFLLGGNEGDCREAKEARHLSGYAPQ